MDAHYGAAMTWDYYKNVFGRNGIRNDGVGRVQPRPLRQQLRQRLLAGHLLLHDLRRRLGGSATPLTSLDVAGHEMTHGVTANTAGLRYSGESGGLNEATSDIFGTAVEFYANNANDPGDYLIGEKIDINGDGTPLRYMDKPSKDGASRGLLVLAASAEPRRALLLGRGQPLLLPARRGQRRQDRQRCRQQPDLRRLPVTGIGSAKAGAIWYRALTVYMTSTTNYAGARTATLSAAARPLRRRQRRVQHGRRGLVRGQRRLTRIGPQPATRAG